MGQDFFRGSGHVHEVHYFTFTNLKGGLISIAIGAVLYAVVIRGLLMEPEEGGTRRYVDRWPAWLDLENLISTVMTVFFALSSVFCRALDYLTDSVVVLMRRTVCRQLPEPKNRPETDRLAHILGRMVDRWVKLRDGLFGKEDTGRVRVSAVHHMIEREKRVKHMTDLVEQSFSFGLMLFCIGLCMTLGYLLFVFYMG